MYKDRYYFNYGHDLSNMSTGNYWPQADAMDVIVDAFKRTSNQYYLNLYPLWWVGAPKFNFSRRPEDPWWNAYGDKDLVGLTPMLSGCMLMEAM